MRLKELMGSEAVVLNQVEDLSSGTGEKGKRGR
jgi:hypothetical protein